tara:strand:+ start:4962 stop:5300 length:339 start_codon:yes stop_codon:yes gene_type:complete
MTALVALSVSNLESELAANDYTVEELTEALELERAKDEPRKTAIEALEIDLEAASGEGDKEPEPEHTGYKVAKGKSITTSVGIKSEGDKVTADMVTGGDAKLQLLESKGFIV